MIDAGHNLEQNFSSQLETARNLVQGRKDYLTGNGNVSFKGLRYSPTHRGDAIYIQLPEGFQGFRIANGFKEIGGDLANTLELQPGIHAIFSHKFAKHVQQILTADILKAPETPIEVRNEVLDYLKKNSLRLKEDEHAMFNEGLRTVNGSDKREIAIWDQLLLNTENLAGLLAYFCVHKEKDSQSVYKEVEEYLAKVKKVEIPTKVSDCINTLYRFHLFNQRIELIAA